MSFAKWGMIAKKQVCCKTTNTIFSWAAPTTQNSSNRKTMGQSTTQLRSCNSKVRTNGLLRPVIQARSAYQSTLLRLDGYLDQKRACSEWSRRVQPTSTRPVQIIAPILRLTQNRRPLTREWTHIRGKKWKSISLWQCQVFHERASMDFKLAQKLTSSLTRNKNSPKSSQKIGSKTSALPLRSQIWSTSTSRPTNWETIEAH